MTIDEKARHDILNRIGAAKMNAELALRHKQLPDAVRGNLERVLKNIAQIQELVTGSPPDVDPNEPSSLSADGASKKCILLIDDSKDLADLFNAILKPRGFEIVIAKNQAEAIAALAAQPKFDLILLDYHLEKATGSEIIDAFAKLDGEVMTANKVVVFSALGERVVEPRAHAIEQKSLDTKSLIALVEKYC